MKVAILEEYKSHLTQDGKRPKTIESYVSDVKGLLKYLQEMGVAFERTLSRFFITSYKNHLLEENYEPTTINKKINSFQSFNEYLINRGYMDSNIIQLRKDRVKIAIGSERGVEVFPEHQVEKLQFYIQNQRKVSLRDKMIILLLLYTGVRVSELCSIKIRNIDFLTGHLKVFGKGGKVREIPLKPEVVEVVKSYLMVRSKSRYRDSEYLILGQRGEVKRDAVNTLPRETYKTRRFPAEAKAPHLPPYLLYHTNKKGSTFDTVLTSYPLSSHLSSSIVTFSASSLFIGHLNLLLSKR